MSTLLAGGDPVLLETRKLVFEEQPTPVSDVRHYTVLPSRPVRTSGPKTLKFLSFCRNPLTLRNFFHLFGTSVASYPVAYVIAAVIISSLSAGMHFMVVKDRVRDGYTPRTAPSRHESDVYREFRGSTGEPMLATVLMRAKDGGSMHRKENLRAADEISNFLHNNLTISLNNGEESITYAQLCAPYCATNLVIHYFRSALESEVSRIRSGKLPASNTRLNYPVAKFGGFEFHLERNFYGVRKRSNLDLPSHLFNENGSMILENWNGSRMSEDEIWQRITDIEFVEVILLVFRGDFSSPEEESRLSQWELGVLDYVQNSNDSILELSVMGAEIVDQEINRDSQKMTPYFVTGFAFMLGFVGLSVLCSAVFYDGLDLGKVLIAIGIASCPILAITSTFGAFSLFGAHTNSLMLIMPFLIMGIGVNDAFLMIHAWQRVSPRGYSVSERLGVVMEEVGPSITITTLTNVITFGIGALTPTPEISLFCLATAIALGFAYIFTLLLLGPVLYAATVCERRQRPEQGTTHLMGWRKKLFKLDKQLLRWLSLYCRLIELRMFFAVLMIGTVAYWCFGVIGALHIKTRLDVQKILPNDSPLKVPNRLISNLIWEEYYPLTILVNSPLDIRNAQVLQRFERMVDEFESMHLCKGSKFTVLWLRDYETYYRNVDEYAFDFYADANEKQGTLRETDSGDNFLDPDKSDLDFARLNDFLSSPFYGHWSSFMKLDNNSKSGIPVRKFWFSVIYHNTSSWERRIELMLQWRRIAESYSDFNVTVWEMNAMFVDQMLSLKTVTVQTGVLTLVCMAAVCALFIQNPCSVITASIAIASISLGVVGFLSWWHLDLDPVTMAAVLMSIGMSVDFTAHVSYNYQLRHRKEFIDGRVVKIPLRGAHDRLVQTLESVAWPMIQGGLSTVMCVLPLVFVQNYIPLVFVKTISLVVIWGLFHGLILVPAFLSSLPDCLININCYRTLFSPPQPPGERNYETVALEDGPDNRTS